MIRLVLLLMTLSFGAQAYTIDPSQHVGFTCYAGTTPVINTFVKRSTYVVGASYAEGEDHQTSIKYKTNMPCVVKEINAAP